MAEAEHEKDYARWLFMQPNPDKPHKRLYSLQQISSKLEERFSPQKFPRQYIHRWAHAHAPGGAPSWVEKFRIVVAKGYGEALSVEAARVRKDAEEATITLDDAAGKGDYAPYDEYMEQTRSMAFKDYSDCREIYDLEKQFIKVILGVNLGEVQRLLVEHNGELQNIPVKTFNKRIPKFIQHLVVRDANARAERLDEFRKEGLEQGTGSKVDLTEFSTVELMMIARATK